MILSIISSSQKLTKVVFENFEFGFVKFEVNACIKNKCKIDDLSNHCVASPYYCYNFNRLFFIFITVTYDF